MSKQRKDDIENLHSYGIYIPTRTIYMGSESSADIAVEVGGESGVDHAMAERTIKNLHILEHINKEQITIICNNPGGDEYHCFAIYDAVRKCESHVTVEVMGHAMSAGSIILQAADRRVMHPTSSQMIHYGTWGIHDHSKTTQKWAKEGERIDHWMEQLYLEKIREKHPDFSLSKIRRMLDHDTFLTARESVNLGLADTVYGDSEEKQ